MDTAEKTTGATILVIDDDRDISQTVKGNLSLDGYRVLAAFDGREGIETARKNRPDLVLLDLNLPDIDGISACRIMRREFDFPIIMLTARDSISDKVLGFECGADDYIIKPFNYLELSARIKAVLKRVSGAGGVREECRTGDLSMDFKARKLSVGEREVKLTKTEFALLELFSSHVDEVLTRDFIQGQVWRDSQLYQHSRALDVHVQRLRKKIEKDPNNPHHIITVTGVGYKFQG